MISNNLFERIDNSKPLDFGGIFSKSIELFKKVWVQGFIHVIIPLAIMLAMFVIMYLVVFVGGFGIVGFTGIFAENMDVDFDEDLVVGIVAVIYMILFALLMLVVLIIPVSMTFAFTAHFFVVCRQSDMEMAEKTDYFMFLKGKYLRKTITLSLILIGIIVLACLLCFFPVIYVMVPIQLMMVIYAFNPDMSVSDLVKASFNLGNRTWLISFGLIFISIMLVQVLGYVTCGLGSFFISSFTYIPIYYIYKDSLGFEDGEFENDETPLLK
ncbi:hypothetical protein [Aquimarina aquimarini]|uniref:hypothetical protein n=1 Tax=Aquimarina aquimarini TaxID=1191734 RepID=UPI000D54B7E2|nr:hypothetical protein [Aquimarina aquimarini]